MALAATSIIEIQSTATAGNLNGGGFNPNNANMLTDLTTNSNTANTSAPIVSSASYNFVAGDVGNWLYIKAGTNWTVGWYKIQSVAANKATLEAAVGSANVRQVVNNLFGTNTVIGCATVGTPTSGTFTIDYSQSTACITSTAVSDYASLLASTNLTSSTAAFTPVMVGNFFCLSGRGTGNFGVAGWYEIVSYTNATTVVTDRATDSGGALVAGVGKIGGAISLGGSTSGIADTNVFTSMVTAGATATTRYFIKGGSGITYTPNAAITMTSGNAAWNGVMESYATSRGDRPLGATRPTIACGTNSFNGSSSWGFYSLIFTGTAVSVLIPTACSVTGCKVINSSTTANRNAIAISSGRITNCEAISYRGRAIGMDTSAAGYAIDVRNNYLHDSDVGVSTAAQAAAGVVIEGNIIEGCVTYGIDMTAVTNVGISIRNNTLYGTENKLGTGINIPTGISIVQVMNNILYGLATGIAHADVQSSCYDDYNNFFNNTADINTANHWQKGAHTTAVNPTFATVAQLTGTTATTTAGNHLVQSGATFVTSGVTAGRDYVYIKSGTGVTAGIYGILSVDSETQITADITLAADATGDKSWQITTGHNFQVGQNLFNKGFPGAFPAALTTGNSAIGAAQKFWNTASRSGIANAT